MSRPLQPLVPVCGALALFAAMLFGVSLIFALAMKLADWLTGVLFP